MSLLSFLFCCLRPRSSSSDDPNENSRLIPASEDVPPAARHVIIDQQRMKERLGVIVRAKEGKMVNVNAPVPFNLNNNTAHRPHHHHAQPPQQTRLDRVRARASSPQPSFDMERQSVLSSASASASPSQEIDEEMTRRPTLNVRIVRPGSALARGRPITRDAAPSSELQQEQQQQQEGRYSRAEVEEAGSDRPVGGSGGEQDGTAATGAIASAQGAHIPGMAFTIQNVGSLSRSWGD